MSRTINEIAQGEDVLGIELAEKAKEVKRGLLELAQEAPEQQLDVENLTGNQQLSPATRKILSITAHIRLEAEEAEDSDDDEVYKRKRLAEALAGRIKTLRSAYSAETGEEPATYFDDEALTSDMNEVSFRRVIAPELHRRGRGPATFGERTEEQPSFPLLGAILRLPPHRHSRDLFSVIVTYKEESRVFPFFLDTGGTQCYANGMTLKTIKPGIDLTGWTPSSYLSVLVHGVKANLYLGQPGTSVDEMNLLGTEWMEKAQLALVCDYSDEGRGCALLRGDDPRGIRQFAPSSELE